MFRENLYGICIPGYEKDSTSAYRMCTNRYCLGTNFASPASPSKRAVIGQGYIPPNTKTATSWAVCAFEQWRDQWNKKSSEECPSDLLEKLTAS